MLYVNFGMKISKLNKVLEDSTKKREKRQAKKQVTSSSNSFYPGSGERPVHLTLDLQSRVVINLSILSKTGERKVLNSVTASLIQP